MTRRTMSAIGTTFVLTLALAACSSSGSSSAPASAPAASQAAPSAASACAPSSDAGTVEVTIKDFAFSPAQITAKVGDVVAFSNGDSTAHTATLDDGTCTTGNIGAGTTGALTFTAAGTYPFHCAIHSSMKGTITVS